MFNKHLKFAIYLIATIGVSSARADTYSDFLKAVELDDAGTVQRLLLRGFDPNAVDRRGQVALVSALVAGAPRAFELILSHPEVRVDAVNAADETPLMMAALRGNLAAMGQLLARGAQVRRPGWSPLHYAASGPEVKAVEFLIERGADLDSPAPNGNTALMMAARYGPQESAELLLRKGANPGLRNHANVTAADLARVVGREQLAKRLEDASR